jgi:signal transduction histidine kinase
MLDTRRLLRAIDPRLGLAARIGWLFGLASAGLSVIAGLYIGRLSESVIEREVGAFYASRAQHVADSIDFRIQSSANALRLLVSALQGNGRRPGEADERAFITAVKSDLSDAAWIGVVDAQGTVVAGENRRLEGDQVGGYGWFRLAQAGIDTSGPERFPELEKVLASLTGGKDRSFYFIAAPMRDDQGAVTGFTVAALAMDRITTMPWRAADSPDGARPVDIFLLNATGALITQLFDNGNAADNDLSAEFKTAIGAIPASREYGSIATADFLVGFARSKGYGPFHGTGWTVVVRESKTTAYRPAQQAATAIALACLALGLALSLGAVMGTRVLLRGLGRVAHSADDLRSGRSRGFSVIAGKDEIATISRSLAALFDDLQASQEQLSDLNRNLERKIEERTVEIRRLSEETRDAAITRERLRMARDLHDTLVHTMLAVLTQIRMMRKIFRVRPELVEDELQRAENAAQEGLTLAREAVTDLRYFAVRDDGLGPAVKGLVKRLKERAEIDVVAEIEADAASLTGSKAETVFRIVEEALHNIQAHAAAKHATVRLALDRSDPTTHVLTVTVEDDGRGFDPARTPAGHYGLIGMREQAETLGAKLEIVSAPGKGTRVGLTVAL